METVAAAVEALGGIAKAAELLRRGHSYRAMAWAATQGRVNRARCGWYVSTNTPTQALIALRVGGTLTCSSAARSYEIFELGDGRTHVHVARHARGLRSPRDYRRALGDNWLVRVHWLDESGRPAARVALADALVLMVRCQPLYSAIASWDSALHTGRLSASEHRRALGSVSPRIRRLIDGRAETGIESIARVRLALGGIPSRPQVWIGKRRVDLLIGAKHIVECDGEADHSGPLDFEDDRRRDAALTTLGYRVLRFSYRQIVEDWDSVEAAIRRALLGVPAELPATSKSTESGRG